MSNHFEQTDRVPKQYELQVFVQDYQSYLFVQMIIEKDWRNSFVNDDDLYEVNDRYHENNNHSLFDVSKKNFSLIFD